MTERKAQTAEERERDQQQRRDQEQQPGPNPRAGSSQGQGTSADSQPGDQGDQASAGRRQQGQGQQGSGAAGQQKMHEWRRTNADGVEEAQTLTQEQSKQQGKKLRADGWARSDDDGTT